MNRFDQLYADRSRRRGTAFNAYICAGDPDLATTELLIRDFERRGVDAIELGVPFSDPVADGPVIQQAAQRALKAGTTLRKILDLVARLRTSCSLPIALMSYYNPIHRYGVARLVDDAADAGVDGLIVPDLCPEEAGELIAPARRRSVSTIFFIAPTTKPERVKVINDSSTGFIYCVSVTGITGARRELPPELRDSLKRLHLSTTLPLAVGFGISSPETVRLMGEVADGVIVGSAICQRIEQHLAEPRGKLVAEVGSFVGRLSEAARA